MTVLPWADQLLGGLELADDLFGCVPGAFHGRVPGPVWPDEASHSPWTDLRGPRQSQPNRITFWIRYKGIRFPDVIEVLFIKRDLL